MKGRTNLGRRRARLLLATSSVAALFVGGGAPAAWAVSPCSITQSGGTVASVSNSSATGNCILVNNRAVVTGNVTNTGSGVLTTSSNGISIVHASVGGAVVNAGRIIAQSSANGISVTNSAVVSGGINNSGTISAAGNGIFVGGFASGSSSVTISSFGGGITNSGAISAGGNGIFVGGTGVGGGSVTISTFSGGITNSGRISAGGNGIFVGGTSGGSVTISTFAGGITNSGTISAHSNGIYVSGVSNFSGGITNSGTITARDGILVGGNANSGGAMTIATFVGGITNSGAISARESGIFVGGNADTRAAITISTFAGGITNSGTISAGGKGIFVGGSAHSFGSVTILTFSGGITNRGMISVGGDGIFVGGASVGSGGSVMISTFAGGITNSGTISAAANGNGIFVTGVSVFMGPIVNSGSIIARGENGIEVNAVDTFSGGISNGGTISAGDRLLSYGIFVDNVSTFSGGISNSGTISAAGVGIAVAQEVAFVSTFLGGISNSGIITGRTGILVGSGVKNFFGGISNSGTIVDAPGGYGIRVSGPNNFSGGISNSGSIVGIAGIFVGNVATFSGGISNSGTISAATGIRVADTNPVSIFDSGTIIGSGGTAVGLTGNAAGNIFTLGPGYSITGNVLGQGADTFQLGGSGSGTFNLSLIGTQYTGFTTFNVVNGVWNTTGVFGQSQAWNVDGGTLAGTGTFQSVNVNSGGTLAPGTPGIAGTFMTINGNLAFQSGAIYYVTVNDTTASRANVAGTVTLNGALDIVLSSGSSYSSKTVYDVLDPTSISGRFSSASVVNAPGLAPNVTYTSNGVFVDLTANIGGGGGLSTNQQNVGNSINNFFNNGGTLPASFLPVFTAAGANLGNVLSQLSGEAATGAERGAFQLTDQFLNLMLDPFVNGRGYGPGAGGAPGGGAIGFAPDQQANLPDDIALAYAAVLGKAPPANFDQRWSAWGAAFGGSSATSGDGAVGSHDISTGTYGFASGMDYHVSPTTVVGFALAGAGTNWGLSNGLGSGYSDAMQVGTYGITWYGPAYLAGALSFGNHWFTTNRSALGDQLTANFVGQSYGARFEGGYRFTPSFSSLASRGGLGWGLGVTPYAAVQVQDFQTPTYSENDTTGGGFGLSYNAMNATDVRTELGARFDDPTLLYGRPLILFGRLAWAHDFASNPALSAAFETLPGSSFTVNGAPIPQNSALTTAGAQWFLAPNWSLIGKFDGEFASGSQTYGGSGTVRYTW